jgi:2-aminoadipate transaminase
MLEAMGRCFPKDARWRRPQGGLVVWVTLPPGVDADEVALEARSRGVLVGRGDVFYVDGGTGNNLRLVFAQAGPARIRAGIRILGNILKRKVKEVRAAATAGAPEPLSII